MLTKLTEVNQFWVRSSFYYETGILSSVRIYLPNTEQLGCYFHYTQCIYRISDVFGSIRKIISCSNFFRLLILFSIMLKIKKIRGMPFSFWNVYQRASLLRTTNLCEGWNSNCKHQLGNSSRNIWGGVIMDLKKKNEIKKVNLEKSEEENPRSPKGENIEMLIQEFEDSKTRSKTI